MYTCKYRKLFLAITLSLNSVIFLYFNGITVIQPHITKLHQYVYQMTSYYAVNNTNTDSLIYFQSVEKDEPVKNKTIVIYNRPSWLQVLPEHNTFDNCEVSACQLYHNNPLKYINNSDAVLLFADINTPRIKSIQKPKEGQIWIFVAWENPFHSHSQDFNKPIFKDRINWTMTYRLDSDIPAPYAFVKKISGMSKNYAKIMSEKTKLAAQVVSHCPTPSLRAQYVKSLKKYNISVTVYGKCGPKKKITRDRYLFQKVEKSYKFYLAFENAFCRDYVTEKLFTWQNRNIVPIVRGDANYEHFYPKNSYIDTRDFKSISDLAKYIKYLDRNDTAYIEYLKAKENYVVDNNIFSTARNSLCQVCKMVHNADNYRNSYSNVHDWFTKGACRKPNDLEINK